MIRRSDIGSICLCLFLPLVLLLVLFPSSQHLEMARTRGETAFRPGRQTGREFLPSQRPPHDRPRRR